VIYFHKVFKTPEQQIIQQHMDELTNTILDLKSQRVGNKSIADQLGITEWKVRKVVQLHLDDRRVGTTGERKQIRGENAIERLNKEVLESIQILGSNLPKGKRKGGKLAPAAPVAVVHLSDNHMNELISTPSNSFDFEIASKRLALLAAKVKHYAKPMGVKKIVVAFGGDLINSDRRIDEVTNMATNRSRAMVLSAFIYQQFILDLREDFFIDCFAITGNEGRAKQELSFSDPGVTDSYDASIYYMLQHMMTQTKDKGLRFHELQGNEAIFTIHQETFLLLHGHQINMVDQRKVQSFIGKHSAMNGTRITHVLAGHIHSAMVSDFASRNSSLSGGNAYSEEALGFCSKASQNMHIVTKAGKGGPGGLDGFKLDLQDVTNVEGYPIAELLATHDARGSTKAAQAARNQARRRVIVI
jgi:hypothetical protein